jgi:serine/threonine protein kinase
VVHRDVTPQNVMISVSGGVKLIDFGIVRSAVQTHRTASGVVKGKFSYMAPESLASAREFDHRADLFALGIVLHETLTGRSLFRGVTDNDTLRRVRTMPVPEVTRLRPDVPPGLTAVIARALERDPDRRFQTATDFLQALEQVSEQAHIHRSVTRLRDEVLERCGDPPLPALTDGERALLEDTTPRAEPLPLDSAHDDAGITVADPVSHDLHDALAMALGQAVVRPTEMDMGPIAPIPESPPVVVPPQLAERDPQLAYFLRQAGLASASRATGEQAPTDPDLADLIAALDR